MARTALFLATIVGALSAAAVSASAVGADRRPVTALLVVGWSRVSIVALDGRQLDVPRRVAASPLGLSPDAQLVAQTNGDSVLLGRVTGGGMTVVVTGKCQAGITPGCAYGADPSFSWRSDGARLAVAVNLQAAPTLLEMVDRSGQEVRRYHLPAQNPERGGRAYHRLVSWSPDGRRLLLLRRDDYYTSAVVVLDVATGRLRTLARINEPHDEPTLSWSPDGRFVAMTTEGRGNDYVFAVIDAATGRRLIACTPGAKRCAAGGTVWASDSRSLFATAPGVHPSEPLSTRIERVYLSGTRTQVRPSKAAWQLPWVALPHALVYQEEAETETGTVLRDVLYSYDLATRHAIVLLKPKTGIRAVVPLRARP
jgi:hypothetical protein